MCQIKRESKLIKSKNLKEDKNIEKEKSEEDNIYSKKDLDKNKN